MSVDFKLYLITDRKRMAVRLPDAVRPALQGGVRAIQVREKDLPVRELLALAQELRALTKEFDARLFINDRVDVAVAVGADGVHLGRESMPAKAVRNIAGRNMLIGVSTHSVDEARAAEADGADFVTFGPVYETLSKMQYGAPLGLEGLRSVKRAIEIPIFALGGINGNTISSVLRAGAYGVAMISAIFGAEEIEKKAQNMIEVITRAEQCSVAEPEV